jgi:hypothetical protein
MVPLQVSQAVRTMANTLIPKTLIITFQRLARYPLLFQHILKYTDDDDADVTDLKFALHSAERVLNRTNEQIKQQENQAKLVFLSNHLAFLHDDSLQLDLTAPTRNGQPRLLIKEGELLKGYSHRRQTKRKILYTYLFSDMLLFTTKNLGLKERLSSRISLQVPDTVFVYRAVSVRPMAQC